MARSHHRKKHKSHLQQFRHSHDVTETTGNSSAASIFGIIGALTGGAVGYFASQGSGVWIGVGLLVGAFIGYYLGRNLD